MATDDAMKAAQKQSRASCNTSILEYMRASTLSGSNDTPPPVLATRRTVGGSASQESMAMDDAMEAAQMQPRASILQCLRQGSMAATQAATSRGVQSEFLSNYAKGVQMEWLQKQMEESVQSQVDKLMGVTASMQAHIDSQQARLDAQQQHIAQQQQHMDKHAMQLDCLLHEKNNGKEDDLRDGEIARLHVQLDAVRRQSEHASVVARNATMKEAEPPPTATVDDLANMYSFCVETSLSATTNMVVLRRLSLLFGLLAIQVIYT
jgi:hypothetical protein